MLSINQCYFGGNLVRDVEVRKVGDKQTSVANFSLAVNSRIKDQENTLFVNCEIWGTDAEDLAANFKKGNELMVFGTLKNDKYTKDGVEKTLTKVRVNKYGRGLVDLLGYDVTSVTTAPAPAKDAKVEKPKAEVKEEAPVEEGDTTPF